MVVVDSLVDRFLPIWNRDSVIDYTHTILRGVRNCGSNAAELIKGQVFKC